jgi:hypothetical protein
MSTKNLARTVIEGGRGRSSRTNRRSGHGADRVRIHQLLTRLRRGDDWDDLVVASRKGVGTFFHDKLGPAERWLASNVGRPWDKVRAALFARFDTRTTAGRHIVFDHMLRSVSEHGIPSCGFTLHRRSFVVDRHGILRHAPTRHLAQNRN